VPTKAGLRYVCDVARARAHLASAAFAVLLVATLAPGCSRGEGSGCATGELNIPDCWAGPFNLAPDFFGAIPASSADALLIRVQSGSDYESFSDGIEFEIDDIGAIRGAPLPDGGQSGLLCPCSATAPSCPTQSPDGGLFDVEPSSCPPCPHQLIVSLPPSVTAPGVPVQAQANPSIVHATLYLQHSCRTQDLALYALAAVTLNPDGSCVPPVGSASACGAPATLTLDAGGDATTPSTEAGAPASTGAPDAGTAPAGPPVVGTSTIAFHDLFDGNENESDAHQRLSYADFDLYFGDPREACPGGLGPPPPCRGHLKGNFNFYFERGQPAQPFP
jgi:hypothetical protein